MRHGYTLVELLVVLFIIIVVFVFGTASFRDFTRRQAVIGVARSVKGDLRLAQEFAFSGKKPTGCNALNGYRFKPGATTYSIVAVCNSPATEFSVGKDNIALPVGISMLMTGDTDILFKVLGQGTDLVLGSSVGITLTETSTGNTQTITVSASGEIL